MAADPIFGAVIRVASGLTPATLDTSLTAPSNVTTIITGVTAGTQIEEVVFQGTGTTTTGNINVFLHDGTTYHLYDQVNTPAVTSSTILAAHRLVYRYGDLYLMNASWSLRVSVTTSGLQAIHKVTATGWDYT